MVFVTYSNAKLPYLSDGSIQFDWAFGIIYNGSRYIFKQSSSTDLYKVTPSEGAFYVYLDVDKMKEYSVNDENLAEGNRKYDHLNEIIITSTDEGGKSGNYVLLAAFIEKELQNVGALGQMILYKSSVDTFSDKINNIYDAIDYDNDFEKIYGSAIDDACRKYNNLASSDRLGYLFITDLHFNTGYNASNLPALFRQCKAVVEIANRVNVDFIAFGGDIIDGETNKENIYTFLEPMFKILSKSRKPISIIVGNHDDNCYGEFIGKSALKNLLIDESNIHNIVYPSEEKCYYSFDAKSYKIICLDYIDYDISSSKQGSSWWGYSQEQIKWLISVLNTTNKDVVIFSHGCPDKTYNYYGMGDNGGYSTDLINLIKAFNDHATIDLYGSHYDFSDKTNFIKFLQVGHTHFDKNDVKISGIPCIITGAAKKESPNSKWEKVAGKDNTYIIPSKEVADELHANSYGYEFIFYDRELGTLSESLFDLVSVNGSTISTFRIGAGTDRNFEL